MKPEIQLTGMDGNVFGIISAVNRKLIAWNKNNPDNKIDKIKVQQEMMSGDYDNAIQTVMKYFNVT